MQVKLQNTNWLSNTITILYFDSDRRWDENDVVWLVDVDCAKCAIKIRNLSI